MRILLSIFTVMALFSIAPGSALAREAVPLGAPESFADLAEKLLPAVVNISSTQKAAEVPEGFPEMPEFPPGSPFEDFFEEFMNRHGNEQPALPAASLGSGFIIDAEKGYVVTNNHVIRDAEEVHVILQDDSKIKAEIVGRDEKTDLAVLKIETKKKLTQVDFGDSDALRVGDWIVAIGNPFGLGGTVTAGIISARQRDINSGPYDDFLQTDASINRGNSGGPMFDLSGKVIGVNTAIFSPSGGSVGIGFAIPSAMVKPVISQLIEYGKTRRGWLGVRIQTVTDEIAESLGLTKAHGALVASVTPGGPAEKAKLKAGDIITEFDGKDVEDMRSLPRIVAETPIDKKTELKYWRDGKEHKAKVVIGELEKAEENGLLETAQETKDIKGVDIDSVGITLSALTDKNREAFNVPDDVEGVAIVKVDPKGEAAEKGLGAGSIIVEINQQAVTTPQEAEDIIAKAVKSKRSSVLLLVSNEGEVRFVALKLKE
ncbi:MAG: DegQ family serine endoprotease [Rhodospirillales bacterium]|nr:DegQ family serine endoprotease [Alphaproteobacteria bacterium]USO03847.1 MAG: DegQ family serine endoprotease [Rhodospirillales bacterium]